MLEIHISLNPRSLGKSEQVDPEGDSQCQVRVVPAPGTGCFAATASRPEGASRSTRGSRRRAAAAKAPAAPNTQADEPATTDPTAIALFWTVVEKRRLEAEERQCRSQSVASKISSAPWRNRNSPSPEPTAAASSSSSSKQRTRPEPSVPTPIRLKPYRKGKTRRGKAENRGQRSKRDRIIKGVLCRTLGTTLGKAESKLAILRRKLTERFPKAAGAAAATAASSSSSNQEFVPQYTLPQ